MKSRRCGTQGRTFFIGASGSVHGRAGGGGVGGEAGVVGVGVGFEAAAALEQAGDTAQDRFQESFDFIVSGRIEVVKAGRASGSASGGETKTPSGSSVWKWECQLKRGAEALHEGDGAASAGAGELESDAAGALSLEVE